MKNAMRKRFEMTKKAYESFYDPQIKDDYREHFNEAYLRKGASSEMLYEHMRQDVKLSDLKIVRKSCHFDENLDFCAIMSEVIDP